MVMDMMNYNLERNYSDALYDAVRVFTSERMPNGNNGYTRGELGSGNHVKEVLKFLEIGDAAANGDTTYLPQNSGDSDIEDNFSLEVIDDSNLNNIRVRINFSSNKPDNFKLSNKCSTSNSNYTCSIVSGLNNNNEFSFSLKGKSNVGGSITVKFNFGNSSAGGQMYDKVYIYGCNGSQSECNSSYPSMSGYQRFLTVDGDKVDNIGGGLTKEVRITVPGVCDDPNLSDEDLLKNGCCDKIDGSKYPDDSKEQDTYIKYCGPVVHMENDCGKDSCNNDGYKAFSHSYVRLRNMKYIIDDLKAGGDLSDYLDYSVNSYCGTYTTEKLDILTPATAASVSGQFFVFDSYNKTDFSNVNAYFRQPFIVERVKSTFFFNYNSWKSNYNKALTDEKNKYDAWQTAVNNVKATFDAWQSSKSNTSYYASIRDLWNNPPDYSPYNVCRTTSRLYNKTNCDAKRGNAYGAYDNAVAAENNAHSDYTNAITTENNAKGAYRTAVTTRTNLQDARNKYRYVEKIFLADGDALICKMTDLEAILHFIKDQFPECKQVTLYGSPRSILMKQQEDLDKLRELGISMIYMGLESGNDEVLTYMKKGVTSQEMIEASQKVKQAKIRLSVTAISGLGGRRLWKEHAKDTGLVLSQMKPDYIGLLTLMIEEDLPLADKIRSGEFEMLNPYDILIETKEMLKYMDCPDCIFRSNHASNYVNLRGTLNQDKEAMINLLDEAIKGNVHLKSEWMRGF